jgi:hypothetical protein
VTRDRLDRGRPGIDADRRGQLVFLAGVVVALALVAMLVGYLQLGYHGDVTAASTDRPVRDSTAFLDRATHESARSVRGSYTWDDRGAAVTATRESLDPRLDTLERARVSEGVVSRVAFNVTAASEWAGSHCPTGPGREFTSCSVDRGVVVQGRDGRTLVLAVGYDLTVTTEEGTTRLTTVVATH